MIVREVEGVDRIRVGGRWRRILVDEDRRVGPCRPDGGTVSVDGIAGDAAAGWQPREGDPCRGHAGGPEAGGGGGWRGRRGGIGMERRRTPRTTRRRRSRGWPSRAGRRRRSM